MIFTAANHYTYLSDFKRDGKQTDNTTQKKYSNKSHVTGGLP